MTYTHVFCAQRKGCRIRVTHVHACSDCVHTRDDTVRLDYASRFVRVIYSSHIVSIKLGTVTNRKQKNRKQKKRNKKKEKQKKRETKKREIKKKEKRNTK